MQRFARLPQGRLHGKQKMKAGVRKNGDFYRAMLCITAVYTVMQGGTCRGDWAGGQTHHLMSSTP